MEAATINPKDASAHYQLGLIYQYRRQYGEAISRFEKAVQIADDETDAHFQLGRIAREQGRLQDAINYFSIVLEQDEKHSHTRSGVRSARLILQRRCLPKRKTRSRNSSTAVLTIRKDFITRQDARTTRAARRSARNF